VDKDDTSGRARAGSGDAVGAAVGASDSAGTDVAGDDACKWERHENQRLHIHKAVMAAAKDFRLDISPGTIEDDLNRWDRSVGLSGLNARFKELDPAGYNGMQLAAMALVVPQKCQERLVSTVEGKTVRFVDQTSYAELRELLVKQCNDAAVVDRAQEGFEVLKPDYDPKYPGRADSEVWSGKVQSAA